MTFARSLFLSVLALLVFSACSEKKEKRDTTQRGPPSIARPTAETYLNGKAFCEKYHYITSNELGKYVKVPVDYKNPKKGTMEIYAYTLRTFDPKKPTVIHIDGGPGGNSHGYYESTEPDYNYIFFDQRGLGCSSPETYSQYINSELYSTDNTVRDMDEIRKAYGITDWSVYGISYGTIPATIYASTFPEATRSAILEGTLGSYRQMHNRDFKAEKYNLVIAGLNKAQLDTFEDLLSRKTVERELIWFFLNRALFIDVGFRKAKQLIESFIRLDGTVDQDQVQKLAEDYLSKEEEPQGPGVVDETVYLSIACKNMQFPKTQNRRIVYDFAVQKFIVVKANEKESEALCESIGVKSSHHRPYEISDYPITKPVYYFQGSHDGATNTRGAIDHWKTVPKGKSYFMLAAKGGHTPNLHRMWTGTLQKEVFKLSVLAQPITQTDLDKVNAVMDSVQRWKLFTDPVLQFPELEQEMSGIRVWFQ